MAKFTKGPWELRDSSSSGLSIWALVNLGQDSNGGVLQPIYEVYVKPQMEVIDNGLVCAMLSYESWRQFPSTNFQEMQKANAALITTAPDLHAVLTALVEEWEEHNTIDPTAPPEPGTVAWLYMMGREVLNKAEGK